MSREQRLGLKCSTCEKTRHTARSCLVTYPELAQPLRDAIDRVKQSRLQAPQRESAALCNMNQANWLTPTLSQLFEQQDPDVEASALAMQENVSGDHTTIEDIDEDDVSAARRRSWGFDYLFEEDAPDDRLAQIRIVASQAYFDGLDNGRYSLREYTFPDDEGSDADSVTDKLETAASIFAENSKKTNFRAFCGAIAADKRIDPENFTVDELDDAFDARVEHVRFNLILSRWADFAGQLIHGDDSPPVTPSRLCKRGGSIGNEFLDDSVKRRKTDMELINSAILTDEELLELKQRAGELVKEGNYESYDFFADAIEEQEAMRARNADVGCSSDPE